MLGPSKLEKASLNDKNSNSFEFNSNGFELGRGFGVSKNVENFGRAPEKGKRIIDKV